MHFGDNVFLPVNLTDVVRCLSFYIGDSDNSQNPIAVVACVNTVADLEFGRLYGRLPWRKTPWLNSFWYWLDWFHAGCLRWAVVFLQICATCATVGAGPAIREG